MARKPSLKKYTEKVGEISIRWNQLERALNVIGFHYLGGDAEVPWVHFDDGLPRTRCDEAPSLAAAFAAAEAGEE